MKRVPVTAVLAATVRSDAHRERTPNAVKASGGMHINARREGGAISVLGIWFFLGAPRDFYLSVQARWHWTPNPRAATDGGHADK